MAEFTRFAETLECKKDMRVVAVTVKPLVSDCTGRIWFTDLMAQEGDRLTGYVIHTETVMDMAHPPRCDGAALQEHIRDIKLPRAVRHAHPHGDGFEPLIRHGILQMCGRGRHDKEPRADGVPGKPEQLHLFGADRLGESEKRGVPDTPFTASTSKPEFSQ